MPRRQWAATARAIAAVGGLAVLVGLFLFLAPSVAIEIWPWSLTPLTARVLGAVFCLAGLGTLVDSRWSSARVPFQVALGMLTMMVVAGVRAYRQFDPTNPVTWLFAVGFVGLTLAILVLYRRMERGA